MKAKSAFLEIETPRLENSDPLLAIKEELLSLAVPMVSLALTNGKSKTEARPDLPRSPSTEMVLLPLLLAHLLPSPLLSFSEEQFQTLKYCTQY